MAGPRDSLMACAQGMCEASPLFCNSWKDQHEVSREVFGNMAAAGLARMVDAGTLGWIAEVAYDHGLEPYTFAHALGVVVGHIEQASHRKGGAR